MATVKQMKARMLSGHIRALQNLSEGKPAAGANATLGELRGMRTVLNTLMKWGAIDSKGNITEIGKQLL